MPRDRARLPDQSAELRDGRSASRSCSSKRRVGSQDASRTACACIRCGNTEDDGVGRARGSDEPGLIPRAHFRSLTDRKIECLPYLLLERDLEVLLADVRTQRVPNATSSCLSPRKCVGSFAAAAPSGPERHRLQQSPHSPPTSTANATHNAAPSATKLDATRTRPPNPPARVDFLARARTSVARVGCPHPFNYRSFSGKRIPVDLCVHRGIECQCRA